MIILRDSLRNTIRIFIQSVLCFCAIGFACALWLETRPNYVIQQIKTPAYVVAGSSLTFTEVGSQRAACMPRVGRGFYYSVTDVKPPHAKHTRWYPLSSNPFPNPVMLATAAEHWHPAGWKIDAKTRISNGPDETTQRDTISRAQATPPEEVALTITLDVDAKAPVGKVQFAEQYDEHPCGIISGLLGATSRVALGPPMTVLPPGSTIPAD